MNASFIELEQSRISLSVFRPGIGNGGAPVNEEIRMNLVSSGTEH